MITKHISFEDWDMVWTPDKNMGGDFHLRSDLYGVEIILREF